MEAEETFDNSPDETRESLSRTQNEVILSDETEEDFESGVRETAQPVEDNEDTRNCKERNDVGNTRQQEVRNEDNQIENENPREQELEPKHSDVQEQLQAELEAKVQKKSEGKNILELPSPQDTETNEELQKLQQKQQNDENEGKLQNKTALEKEETNSESVDQCVEQNNVGTEEHRRAKQQNQPAQNDGYELSNDTSNKGDKVANKKPFEVPSNDKNSTDVTDTRGKILWKGRYVPLDNLKEILHEEVSSTESGTEEDSVFGVEKKVISKRAFQQIESDKQFDFSDSASDISEDMEMNVKTQTNKQKETFKLLAEKEFFELKYHRTFHEKEELQKQMKKLEVENESLAKKHQLAEQPTNEPEKLKAVMKAEVDQKSIKENEILLEPTPTKDQSMTHNTESPLNTDSAIPTVNGYADDIANLAMENKKFDEIIDRLQLNPKETLQEKDPLIEEMLESIEKFVPKNDFLLLEQEKLNIESLLREKDKQYKEKAKELEEATIDFEDKTKGFEKAIKRLEEREKDKSQLLNEYELQIFDLKRKFKERLDESESNFENERIQKTKFQEELEKLKNSYAEQEEELGNAKSKVEKLELEMMDTNEKYAKELTKLREKLEKENEEKIELGTRVQSLLQEMLQLKDELTDESKKHSEEQKHTREYFDEERMKLVDKHHEEIQLLMEKLINPKTQSFINVNLNEAAKDQDETEPKIVSEVTLEKSEKQDLRSNKNLDCVNFSSRKDISEDPTNKTSLENIEKSDVSEQVNVLKKKNKVLQEKVALLENELAKLKDTEKDYKDPESHFEQKNQNEKKQNLEPITETASNKQQAAKESEDLFQKLDLNSANERERETLYYNKEADVSRMPGSEFEYDDESHGYEITHSNNMDRKINSLLKEINQLKYEKDELEKEMIESKENLEDEYQRQLERERKRFKMVEDEIASNASGLRRVAEDWEQMLTKRVSYYEKELERSEQEKAKLQAKLQSLENNCLDKYDQGTQNDRKQWEKETSEALAKAKDHGSHALSEEKNHFQIPNNMFTQDVSQTNENEVQCLIKFLESERKRLQCEYEQQLNNEKKYYDLLISEKQERVKYLEKRTNSLENDIKALEEKKNQEQKDLLISFENEKTALKAAAEKHFVSQLNENKNDYERTLREMRLQMEVERKDLQERIFKSREVLQEKIENEFLRKVLKIIKENTGNGNREVPHKTQEYKYKVQQLAKQIEEERNKFSKTISNLKENFISEQTKAEAQSKANSAIMEKTIEELKKEVENLKKLKQELKQNYRSDISQLEERHEKEIKELNENCQKLQKKVEAKLQEEAAENLRKEREVNEDKVHKANCELRNVQIELVKMETKFNAEKYEMEKVIDEMKFEILSLRQTKTNSAIPTEKHLSRSFEIEKDNIENNFHVLRQEIFRLQGYIAELRAQLVSSNIHIKTQVNSPRILRAYSSEMPVAFENEYRHEFSKEKAKYDDTTYELQCQMENLKSDMSLIKGKVRHVKISMQEDLDKERDVLEERFIREQEDMRSLIKMIVLKHSKSDHNEVRDMFLRRDMRTFF